MSPAAAAAATSSQAGDPASDPASRPSSATAYPQPQAAQTLASPYRSASRPRSGPVTACPSV